MVRWTSAVTEFSIHAAKYVRDESLGSEVLVLAEGADGSGRRLELQRALVVTDQDRRLGQDTYCLVNEAGACHYGGVSKHTVVGDELRLELTPRGAVVLGSDGEYVLKLAVSQACREEVKEGLGAILGYPPDGT